MMPSLTGWRDSDDLGLLFRRFGIIVAARIEVHGQSNLCNASL